MLGVPASPGVVGWLMLAFGTAAGATTAVMLGSRIRRAGLITNTAAFCVLATMAVVPYVVWRIVEDLRVTTRLHGYDRAAAGPIQAFLPGYFVDGARSLIPADSTYATVVSTSVPWPAARAAFPSLALQTLFPRVSVDDPRQADYLLAWGVNPRTVAPVSRVWVTRPRVGAYPAVFVGRVLR